MTLTAKNIQIFIMTHNRPALLKETMDSVFAQNMPELECRVLDNSDNDDTQEMMRAFPAVRYARNPRGYSQTNFKKAQELMDKEYAMVLHDDDILHPGYLRLVLDILNKTENVSFISGGYDSFTGKIPDKYHTPVPLRKEYYLLDNQSSFAMSFWMPHRPLWSGSLIKTSIYKKLNTDRLYKDYGKITDIPLLIESMLSGNAVIINDRRTLFYRIHPQQDSGDNATGIGAEQLLNWMRLFCKMSRSNAALRNIYFTQAVHWAKDIYKNYLRGEIKKELPLEMLLSQMKNEKLITGGMIFYHNRNKSIFHKIINTPRWLFLKADYYGQFLKQL